MCQETPLNRLEVALCCGLWLARVLRVGGNPQIGPSVVQAVTVPVVHLGYLTRCEAQDDPVHRYPVWSTAGVAVGG